MDFKQIKRKRLVFDPIGDVRYIAFYEGHEIGIQLGDFPPEPLYNIYIDRAWVHSGDNLPWNWRIDRTKEPNSKQQL